MRRWTLMAVCAVGILVATPAFADAGIPLIACVHPGLWLVLPIVMLFEGAVGIFVFRWKVGTAAKITLFGNVLSTLAGIPFKWLLVWSLSPVASSFASIVRHSHDSVAAWQNGTAVQKLAIAVTELPMVGWGPFGHQMHVWLYWSVLLIPFFLLSVWVEWRVAVKILGRASRTRAARWAWIANGLSYALIAGLFWHIYAYTWWWTSRP